MTELVQPYKLADTSLALKYDAWNRLVEVESYYGTTLATQRVRWPQPANRPRRNGRQRRT